MLSKCPLYSEGVFYGESLRGNTILENSKHSRCIYTRRFPIKETLPLIEKNACWEVSQTLFLCERTERLWQTGRDQIRYSSSSPTMRKELSRQRWRSLEQRTWEHISGRWRLTAISSRWTTRSRRNLPPQSAVLPQTSIRFAAASTPPDTSMRTILQS